MDTSTVFSSYSHDSEETADVTFNVKDLKALVQLCEAMAANVLIRFQGPGMPLVAEPHFGASNTHVRRGGQEG